MEGGEEEKRSEGCKQVMAELTQPHAPSNPPNYASSYHGADVETKTKMRADKQ